MVEDRASFEVKSKFTFVNIGDNNDDNDLRGPLIEMVDRPLAFDQTNYFTRITENLRQYYNSPSKFQLAGIIFTAFLDPFMQNITLALLFLYMMGEVYVNESLATALSFFICTYLVVTFISSFILALLFTARENARKLKWLQVLLCILNLEYFLFVFVPSVSNYYYIHEIF